jgi:hypothetical protein
LGTWEIKIQFDRPFYPPGSDGVVNFWLENRGPTIIWATECGIQFEFQTQINQRWPCQCSAEVQPGQAQFVGSSSFVLPSTIAGTQLYRVLYRIWEWNQYIQQWQDLGPMETAFNYGINLFPQPFYRAFISRGIRPEDKLLGDQITEMVREWGFEPVTVGIEVQTDPNLLKEAIKNEIQQSHCLIAIATPRSLDALTGLWRTLEWLPSEVGIAFGRDKPILVIRENSVALGGLPGEFRDFTLEFNPFDMQDLKARMGTVMPGFRDWIATKHNQEFLNSLGRVAMGIMAITGIGMVASAIGKSSRKSE